MAFPWHLYLMALLYIAAGINHFIKPRAYERIIPPAFPHPGKLNIIAGAAEIMLGILLCIPASSSIAAIGIIALLIAIFPANIYMYINDSAGLRLPKWLLLLRLPLQAVLVLWAYQYILPSL